jgi:hypothetical protein
MEGIAERDRRAIERDVALAWRCEVFARTKTLEPLQHYLDQMKRETPEAKRDRILNAFRDLQARGTAVKITHVPANDSEQKEDQADGRLPDW